MIEAYSKKIEAQMQEFYSRLPKKSSRLYAGVEALKLPYGGISYIAELLVCSRDTVSLGIKELGEAETLPKNRNRKASGAKWTPLSRQYFIKIKRVSIPLQKIGAVPLLLLKKPVYH